MSTFMPEIAAMQAIADAISPLSPSERRRVAVWLTAYAEDDAACVATRVEENDVQEAQVDIAESTEAIIETAELESDNAQPASFAPASFAILFDVVAPKTGAQKAVTAAYWLQTQEGKQSWKASEINKLLKSIDVNVSSISIVLSNAVKAKNPLVTELERLGDGERSRKTFCLNAAGISFVEERTNNAAN